MGKPRVLRFAGAMLLSMNGVAFAADMLGAPVAPPPDLSSPQMEFGTGWYLRGSVAISRDKAPQLSADVLTSAVKDGAGVELGFGYKFNDWFRMDLTGDWRKTRTLTASGANVTCPYQLTGLSTQVAPIVEVGYLWDSTKQTCTPKQDASMKQLNLMLNGYVDLGTWSGITPYVGAGVGTSILKTGTNLNYYKTSDGSLYAADLTPSGTYPQIWVDANGNQINPQPTVAFAKQNWSRAISRGVNRLAFAAMAGIAINVSDNAKIDIGYRYLNSGNYTSLPSPVTGATTTSRMSSQEVRVGFRYMVD